MNAVISYPANVLGSFSAYNMTVVAAALILAPVYQATHSAWTSAQYDPSLLRLSGASGQLGLRDSNMIGDDSFKRDNQDDDVVGKLSQYGYLPPEVGNMARLRSVEQFSEALRQFQRFANLPQTGRLDSRTRAQFKKRRCGVPDILPNGRRRRRRFALQGSKWWKTDLTWTIANTADSLSRSQVYEELSKAFQVWSSASVLTFTYVERTAEADIIVSFQRGNHQDGYAFDGNGQVLAHAFFPGSGRGGDTHFDSDERWVNDEKSSSRSVSLFTVAVHEFGHSLGLSHSSREDALMYPWYQRFPRGSPLPEDDRRGLLKLYGRDTSKTNSQDRDPPRVQTNVPTTRRPLYEQPNPCSASYDAISLIGKDILIFSGKYFWRINEKTAAEKPTALEISKFWHGLPKNLKRIDAIYERVRDGKVFIFIGDKYWRFTGHDADTGYPQPLTSLGLPRIVTSIDAAVTWSQNNKTYLFKDQYYWRIDKTSNKVDDKYPKHSRAWSGAPTKIDSAFNYDGSTYFFRHHKYWRYDDSLMSVVSRVPSLSASKWMPSCWNEPVGGDP